MPTSPFPQLQATAEKHLWHPPGATEALQIHGGPRKKRATHLAFATSFQVQPCTRRDLLGSEWVTRGPCCPQSCHRQLRHLLLGSRGPLQVLHPLASESQLQTHPSRGPMQQLYLQLPITRLPWTPRDDLFGHMGTAWPPSCS